MCSENDRDYRECARTELTRASAEPNKELAAVCLELAKTYESLFEHLEWAQANYYLAPVQRTA